MVEVSAVNVVVSRNSINFNILLYIDINFL